MFPLPRRKGQEFGASVTVLRLQSKKKRLKYNLMEKTPQEIDRLLRNSEVYDRVKNSLILGLTLPS